MARRVPLKKPNGYGCIKKLSGNRRRKFAVYITTGYDDNGRQIQAPIGYYETYQEADIALAKYNDDPYDINARNTTFGEIYDILYETKFSKLKPSAKTVYTTAYAKCTPIKDMKIRSIKAAHMRNIVSTYRDKSASTQNNIIILFHAIFEFALGNDICQKDYSKFVRTDSPAKKKERTPFSRSEVLKLWELHETAHADTLIIEMLLVMLYTGMRISELLDLRSDDIHIDERWIDLRGTKTPSAKRIIPIHKKISSILKKRSESNSYLFSTEDNKRISYNTYSRAFREFMDRSGMNHTTHECRHTFVSICAACNMNEVLKKKITGHKSSDITDDIYTHAYIEDLVREIDKFDY